MLNENAYKFQILVILLALSIDLLNIYIFYRLNNKPNHVSGISGLVPVILYILCIGFYQFENHIPLAIVLILIAARLLILRTYGH